MSWLKWNHYSNFDSVITSCVAAGWVFCPNEWDRKKVCWDWHKDVGSVVYCHLLLPQCFMLGDAKTLAASPILSALCVWKLRAPYEQCNGAGRWWRRHCLIMSKRQGWPLGQTKVRTKVRNQGASILEHGLLNFYTISSKASAVCCYRTQTLLESPWVGH